MLYSVGLTLRSNSTVNWKESYRRLQWERQWNFDLPVVCETAESCNLAKGDIWVAEWHCRGSWLWWGRELSNIRADACSLRKSCVALGQFRSRRLWGASEVGVERWKDWIVLKTRPGGRMRRSSSQLVTLCVCVQSGVSSCGKQAAIKNCCLSCQWKSLVIVKACSVHASAVFLHRKPAESPLVTRAWLLEVYVSKLGENHLRVHRVMPWNQELAN